jgi:hypothetical protein
MRGVKLAVIVAALAVIVSLFGILLWSGGGPVRRTAAERASAQFHTRFDAGLYREIYADAYFPSDSEESFVAFLDRSSRMIGRCDRAIPTQRIFHFNLGASETADMQYTRRCEKADVSEAALWQWNGGRWRLVQFHLAPLLR